MSQARKSRRTQDVFLRHCLQGTNGIIRHQPVSSIVMLRSRSVQVDPKWVCGHVPPRAGKACQRLTYSTEFTAERQQSTLTTNRFRHRLHVNKRTLYCDAICPAPDCSGMGKLPQKLSTCYQQDSCPRFLTMKSL